VKILIISAPAKVTLKEIFKYTFKNFGAEQADHYQRQIIAAAMLLCSNQIPHARNCSLLLDSTNNDDSQFFYIREGMHYLIYAETAEHIVLHDFIHVNRDIPTLLKSIKRYYKDSQ